MLVYRRVTGEGGAPTSLHAGHNPVRRGPEQFSSDTLLDHWDVPGKQLSAGSVVKEEYDNKDNDPLIKNNEDSSGCQRNRWSSCV